MALNKANISWSTKQLTKMFENGRIKTDNIYQSRWKTELRWM